MSMTGLTNENIDRAAAQAEEFLSECGLKPSQVLTLLASILLAVVCGLLGLLLPEEARIFLSQDLVSPLFNTFMGLLTAVAGPMIFLSVSWGIYSIGDTATLGRIGSRMIGRFLVISLLVGVGMLGLFLPFFSLSGSGNASFNLRELLEMVLDIVPGNFFTPFTEGNLLQIIFVAVLIGLALLVLGSKTTVAASFIEQSNYIVQLIMEGISALVPLFVFGSIFTMILNKNFAALAGAYKWPLLVLLGEAALVAIYLLAVSIRKKVGVGTLAKKLFPTFLICLSTASSSAAFSTNVETCEKDLGIDRRIVNFGIPLGQGVPVLVLLMILVLKDLKSGVAVAVVGFSINFAAYVSEMMRTGIETVDAGQLEAAQALGFSRTRAFWKVTAPQAVRTILPVYRGEFISMVKMTSVVGYITIQDLTRMSDIVRGLTYDAFFSLISTAIIYFALANLMAMSLSALEKRLDPKRRKRIVKGVVMA